LPRGQVIRTHSNICYVLVDGQELECRPRGKLRLDGQDVLAGDYVEVMVVGEREGRIDRVLPRRSVLQRPQVANVDQVVVVFTLREPEINLPFLDRVLVHAEQAGVRPILVLNKTDLYRPAEVDAIREIYRPAGYPVLPMAARHGDGIDALRPLLLDRLSVLAGQSGVGKSRLIRALEPSRGDVRVGEISEKLGRGKHTTRHVELISTAGGLLADAPGFTYLEFTGMMKQDLAPCFSEFRDEAAGCRFSDCLHRAEPDCAVRAAVDAGGIARSRYEHYLQFLNEIEQLRRW
jgi:ribosome biogenesis GTPase / thiamine phosphate phosphatase